MTRRTRRTLVGALVAVAALGLYGVSRRVCIETWWRTRVVLPRCPDGALRQTLSVSAHGLRRGVPGAVRVAASAVYTLGDSEQPLSAPVRSFAADLFLVDAAGMEPAIAPYQYGWRTST